MIEKAGAAGAELVDGVGVIRFPLLAQATGLLCAMSSRRGGVSPEPYGMNTGLKTGDDAERVRLNRGRFLGHLNLTEERLATPSQVHGDLVRPVTAPGRMGECDALITRKRGVVLAISVADCLPVFLYDPVGEAVGIVHAGWRGTKLGILSRALHLLEGQSTRPEDLIACVGPGAGVCCYEVGEEVAQQFDPAFVRRETGKKPRLDLKGINREILLLAGVPASQIEVSGACTICRPDLLHSFRRDGERSGRMMGVIGLL